MPGPSRLSLPTVLGAGLATPVFAGLAGAAFYGYACVERITASGGSTSVFSAATSLMATLGALMTVSALTSASLCYVARNGTVEHLKGMTMVLVGASALREKTGCSRWSPQMILDPTIVVLAIIGWAMTFGRGTEGIAAAW